MTAITQPALTGPAEFAYPKRVGRPKIKADQFNFRLPLDVATLLDLLAESTGMTRTQVIEESVREYAKRRGIKAPGPARTPGGASLTAEASAPDERYQTADPTGEGERRG